MSAAVSRKIRFGLAAETPQSVQSWRELARKAEDLGYDAIHVVDHLGRQWSPLLALLSAADATTRLRVGTQVLANDFRLPVMLAKEVATLDVLTGGRFECGIGVGHPPTSPTGQSDYNQLGSEMDEPGPRDAIRNRPLAAVDASALAAAIKAQEGWTEGDTLPLEEAMKDSRFPEKTRFRLLYTKLSGGVQ